MRRLERGLEGLEMVLGGWLDVAWGLEAGFWSLVAGFGRPGGPQGVPGLRQYGLIGVLAPGFGPVGGR